MPRRRGTGSAVSFFAFQDIITAVTGVLILVVLLLAILAEAAEKLEDVESHAVNNDGQPKITTEQVEELEQQLSAIQSDIRQKQQFVDLAAEETPEQIASKLQKASDAAFRLQTQLNALRATIKEQLRRLDRLESQTSQGQDLVALNQRISDLQAEIEEVRSDTRVIYNFSNLGTRTAWLIEISKSQYRVAEMDLAAPPKVYNGLFKDDSLKKWIESLEKGEQHFFLLVRPDAVLTFDELKEWLDQRRYSVGFDVISDTDQVIDDQKGAGQ